MYLETMQRVLPGQAARSLDSNAKGVLPLFSLKPCKVGQQRRLADER
jgi:hypothetical protein